MRKAYKFRTTKNIKRKLRGHGVVSIGEYPSLKVYDEEPPEELQGLNGQLTIGAIHKPRCQIFGQLWPPPLSENLYQISLMYLLSKMAFSLTPSLLNVHVVYGCPIVKNGNSNEPIILIADSVQHQQNETTLTTSTKNSELLESAV